MSYLNNGNSSRDLVEFPKSPTVFGPGVWLSIHILAIDSVNDMAIDFFMAWIDKMVYRLTCPTCVKHSIEYLSKNPIEPYINSVNSRGIKNGMFIWSWKFHNNVNERLDKEVISFENAYNMYLPKYTPDNVYDIPEDNSMCILKR